jgi:hypothetical protein
LVGYVQDNIKGKGMDIVSKVVEYVKHSSAPRLTNYNHEEECKFQEEMLAAVSESVIKSIEATKRLAEEEVEYAKIDF